MERLFLTSKIQEKKVGSYAKWIKSIETALAIIAVITVFLAIVDVIWLFLKLLMCSTNFMSSKSGMEKKITKN